MEEQWLLRFQLRLIFLMQHVWINLFRPRGAMSRWDLGSDLSAAFPQNDPFNPSQQQHFSYFSLLDFYSLPRKFIWARVNIQGNLREPWFLVSFGFTLQQNHVFTGTILIQPPLCILSIRAMGPILLVWGVVLPCFLQILVWINPLQNLQGQCSNMISQSLWPWRVFQPINWTEDELTRRTAFHGGCLWRWTNSLAEEAPWSTWVKGSLMFSFPVVWMEIHNDRLA